MASISELMKLHNYEVQQDNAHGWDSFADELNSQMEKKYEEKKKSDRQDLLLKKLKDQTGDLKREITLDQDGKISAKFSDKNDTQDRSRDKDVWKRAQDIAKATHAKDNPFYTPSIDQIMEAIPAAKAMFEGDYPSMAAPSPSVTPTPPEQTPNQGNNFSMGNLIGTLMQKFGGQAPQQGPMQGVPQGQGTPMQTTAQPAANDIRALAIQELQNAGYPVTENNVRALIDQMTKQGA